MHQHHISVRIRGLRSENSERRIDNAHTDTATYASMRAFTRYIEVKRCAFARVCVHVFQAKKTTLPSAHRYTSRKRKSNHDRIYNSLRVCMSVSMPRRPSCQQQRGLPPHSTPRTTCKRTQAKRELDIFFFSPYGLFSRGVSVSATRTPLRYRP